MSTQKTAAAKSAAEMTDTEFDGTPLSLTRWIEITSTARNNLIQCTIDVTETSQIAAHTVIEAVIGYGAELHNINTDMAALFTASLPQIARNPATKDGSGSNKTGINTSEMMKQFRRIIEANSRLVEASSAACQALSTVPAQVLDTIVAA